MSKIIPFFISIPHSGEKVPVDCDWLHGLPEEILMCDVDRYVDRLYQPAVSKNNLPCIMTEWHRYAVDLNRVPTDIDEGSVLGCANKKGMFSRGYHWQMTTLKTPLMKRPMSLELHKKLTNLIYDPFHQSIQNQYQGFRDKGFQNIYHLDCHSMPSMGTSEHRDPGQRRADIVVSDCHQKSSEPRFVELVRKAYADVGFQVAYNWPYFGGRVSEQYGDPKKGQHAVQVEISRVLYMDEKTKQINPDISQVQDKVLLAVTEIQKTIEKW